jgi:hypothetical protein
LRGSVEFWGLGVDFETSDILQGTATVFSAYGTAVIAKPKKKEE